MLKGILPIVSLKVSGHSMEPTFSHGQRLFIVKRAFAGKTLAVGELVVVKHPRTGALLVKRVAAGPHQEVRLQWGRLFVDRYRVEHSKLASANFGDEDEDFFWRIPADSYFVLGDNPAHSTDSRHFGYVPRSAIIGKVIGSA
ncbi:MAG: signal peptidase I [Candidatus Spechtbacterales bacterium]